MKFFAALFVALVAVHASTQSPLEDGGIAKTVADILTKFLADTKIVLDRVNAWADQLDSNKDQYEKTTVEFLTKIGLEINGVIIKLVEKLKVDASADGKAILDCVEAEQPNVDAIIGKVLQQIAACEFENYEDFSALAETVQKQLTELQANFETLTANLSGCGGGDSICMAIFMAGVVEQAGDVATNVKADLGGLKGLISGLLNSTKQCKIVETIHKDATEVLNNAAKCIKK